MARLRYAFFNHGFDLGLTKSDIADATIPGLDAWDTCEKLAKKRYIRKQIKQIGMDNVISELLSVWDIEELQDFNENICRIVWLTACEISENYEN